MHYCCTMPLQKQNKKQGPLPVGGGGGEGLSSREGACSKSQSSLCTTRPACRASPQNELKNSPIDAQYTEPSVCVCDCKSHAPGACYQLGRHSTVFFVVVYFTLIYLCYIPNNMKQYKKPPREKKEKNQPLLGDGRQLLCQPFFFVSGRKLRPATWTRTTSVKWSGRGDGASSEVPPEEAQNIPVRTATQQQTHPRAHSTVEYRQ